MLAQQTIDQAKGFIDVLLALLDWPFLLFVFLLLLVLIFKKKVMGLFERGDIQIGWGEGRHIKLKELSDGIDEEIDPIRRCRHVASRHANGFTQGAHLKVHLRQALAFLRDHSLSP